MKKVAVDQYLCIGCGQCMALCPKVFQLGADGLAGVVHQVTEETMPSVQEAVDSCPATAIYWADQE